MRTWSLRIEFPQPGIRSWQAIKEVPTSKLGGTPSTDSCRATLCVGRPFPDSARFNPAGDDAVHVSERTGVGRKRPPRSEPILVDTVTAGKLAA